MLWAISNAAYESSGLKFFELFLLCDMLLIFIRVIKLLTWLQTDEWDAVLSVHFLSIHIDTKVDQTLQENVVEKIKAF